MSTAILPTPNLCNLADMGLKHRCGQTSEIVDDTIRNEAYENIEIALNKSADRYELDVGILGWDNWRAVLPA